MIFPFHIKEWSKSEKSLLADTKINEIWQINSFVNLIPNISCLIWDFLHYSEEVSWFSLKRTIQICSTAGQRWSRCVFNNLCSLSLAMASSRNMLFRIDCLLMFCTGPPVLVQVYHWSKCYETIQDFAPTTASPESLSNLGIPSNSWSWGRMLKTLKQEKRIWCLQ